MNNIFEDILKHFELPIANPVLVFAIILFIILISPLALRKLRMPAVVGFILAGIICKPQNKKPTLITMICKLFFTQWISPFYITKCALFTTLRTR